jgi:hypothetical protein
MPKRHPRRHKAYIADLRQSELGCENLPVPPGKKYIIRRRFNPANRDSMKAAFQIDQTLEGMARDAKGSSNEGGNKRHLVPLILQCLSTMQLSLLRPFSFIKF